MRLKKTKLVLGMTTATLALAGAMVSTQVVAHEKAYYHCVVNHRLVPDHLCPHYKHKHSHKKSSSSKVATRAIEVTPTQVAAYDDSALKQQLADQAAEIAKLKTQPIPAPVVAEPVKANTKDNMVFFRGGYGHSNRDRNGVSIVSDVAATGFPALDGGKADKDAWYMGAGFDFSVSDDLFGLAKGTGTEVLAELMFDYKEFGTTKGNVLANNGATVPNLLLGNGLKTAPRSVTVNQFTLAASPKIKFLKGQDFRPWIQPVGFALQVISPPSESITVLQPAMMFGVGADYRVWQNIYVGADARYHQALGGRLDGVNTNGFTAGGYIGLGF